MDTWSAVWRESIAGGLGGMCGMAIGIPFDLVKVRMQTLPHKFHSTWQTAALTVREEGVLALFKGSLSPLAAQVPIKAMVFASECAAMKVLQPELKPDEVGATVNLYLAGSFAGLTQCLVLVPSDLVKCRLQVDCDAKKLGRVGKQQYKGNMDCVAQTLRHEGIAGLFRGFWITALREVPSYGVYFGVYRQIKQALTKEGETEPPLWGTLLAGGMGGCASWAVVYPVDVVKSVIQAAPPGTAAEALVQAPAAQLQQQPLHRMGLMAVARQLMRERGVSFLYRGLGVTMLRAAPVNAAIFYFYELWHDLLRPGVAEVSL